MTANVAHPSRAHLAAFALDKLDTNSAASIRKHLEVCAECRTVVDNTPHDSFAAMLNNAAKRSSDTDSRHKSNTLGTAQADPGRLDESEFPVELQSHSRYRIIRKLGQGGMGAVYQAEHRIMERVVAIKVIAPELVSSAEAVERFHREVRAAAKLEHPNIVRAYDADQAGTMMLLAMEFVQGRTLDEIVEEKGALPIAYACHCIRQTALGLQHAADHKMVHRDIKPHNLMLTNKGVVKILDFGLAKLVSERTTRAGLTAKEMAMGTPEYMAPEQARDTASADVRADIYALGCTLFHVLTGKPPFVGGTAIEIITRHLMDVPPRVTDLRAEVPAGLADLIGRMLAKNPAERPQTPKEVAEELKPFAKAGAKSALHVEPAQAPVLAMDARNAFVDMRASPTLATAKRTKPISTAKKRRWVVPVAFALGLNFAAICLWAVGAFSGRTSTTQPQRTSTSQLQRTVTSQPQPTAVSQPLRPASEPRRDSTAIASVPRDDRTTPSPPKFEPPPIDQARFDDLNLGGAIVQSDFVQLPPGSKVSTKKSFSGPIEISVIARTAGVNIRLDAYRGSGVIFNWEVNKRQLRVRRPDGGQRFESGSLATAQVLPLEPNIWYHLKWRIQPDGMQVFVDDKLVFTENHSNDVNTPGQVWIRSMGSEIGFKELRVTPLAISSPAPKPPPAERDTAPSISAGLLWLAQQQKPDGRWVLDGTKAYNDDAAATGLALLPFLAAGYADRAANAPDDTHVNTVYKGLAYLRSQQKKDGSFGCRQLYGEAIVARATCEASAVSQDSRLGRAAQSALDFLTRAQHQGGGWRYRPGDPGDTSVTGWVLTALKTGSAVGLKVDEAVYVRAGRFLDSVQSQNGATYGYTGPGSSKNLTAVGLLCRQYLGWSPNHAPLVAGLENLKHAPPQLGKGEIYYYYYATGAFRHVGGDYWHKVWYPEMRNLLLDTQDLSNTPTKGSWQPDNQHTGQSGGRLTCTSLSLLTLGIETSQLALHKRVKGTESSVPVDRAPYVNARRSAIPDDAVKFGRHSYKVFREPVSWTQAKERCEQMGGRLACPATPEELEFLAKTKGNAVVWIGGSKGQDGQWRWVTGKLVTLKHDGKAVALAFTPGKDLGGRPESGPDRRRRAKLVQGFICEWDN